MELIDNVLGIDWSTSKYVGDGVYMTDSTSQTGMPSVALRTDRMDQQHIILLEKREFEDMVKTGQEIMEKHKKVSQDG